MLLGFIGLGTIASAVVRGIAGQDHHIYVSPRSKHNSTELSRMYKNVSIAENQDVIDASDILFIGTTAEVAPDILRALTFKSHQKVVSLMAGFNSKELQELVAPANYETNMIPFPSIAHGGSPILTFPESEIITDMFEPENTVITIENQAYFNEFLAAQAILSPIIKILDTGAKWLGNKTGDTHSAEQFLRLLVGAAINSEPIDAHNTLAKLLNELNTPGGLNAQLREHMEMHNTYSDLVDGLDRLSKQLSPSEHT